MYRRIYLRLATVMLAMVAGLVMVPGTAQAYPSPDYACVANNDNMAFLIENQYTKFQQHVWLGGNTGKQCVGDGTGYWSGQDVIRVRQAPYTCWQHRINDGPLSAVSRSYGNTLWWTVWPGDGYNGSWKTTHYQWKC